MKATKSICLSLLLLAGATAAMSAEPFRTDINPALQYYQAFILAPELPQADRDYLFTNEWRGQKLPVRFGELIGRYDNEFRFVRRAAHATVPCDWGIDMSPGPYTLLPGLARNKGVAVTARLRALWHLQNGRPDEARDDLLAALALGRRSAQGGTLIAALVQIAIEQILCSTVAENFGRFSPETLTQLAEGFNAGSTRGTMVACILAEKSCFPDWLETKILALQKVNPGNDAKVMAGLRDLFTGMESPEEGNKDIWGPVDKAAGGTSAGVLKLLREEGPLYLRLAGIMALPPPEFESQVNQFYAEIRKSSNPFASITFPAFEKARTREFAIQANLAMVQAAVEYKLHGEQGLQSVSDPCGTGPFEFKRFVFDGVDRGFQLTSAYAGRGYPEALIFVEKDGPAFYVNGKNIGKALAK